VITNELLVATDTTGARGVDTLVEAVDAALEGHQGLLRDGLDVNVLRLVPRLALTEKEGDDEK
tara:strand:- start:1174 stop:1362 length:189 start_codon:yes stop_codon:yes gene_type:complete